MNTKADSISRDRAMIENPRDWPRWPMLPLKKRGFMDFRDKDSHGFILCTDPIDNPVLYLTLIYSINDIARDLKKASGRDSVTWGEIIAEIPKRTYSSLDALLADYTVD